MYFKRMIMHGFKSFADPVTVEFDRGITCVVGPNGSGKSNISDALRWVLGEQSPKMLRGGRMEEVIFAGTDTRRSRGMAEVSLVIDNSEHDLPIDFSEVSITRRMYRSGESEYLINGSACRLRDIRELIMDTGIGVDGYSIIGQGKISEIINGRPESRREIFEEAAGIVRYRNRKAEAEKKLDSTATDLERVTDIITELEGRIEPLKTESARAETYLALNGQYRENEINLVLKNIEQTERQNEILLNDAADLDLKLAMGENERSGLDTAIARKKQDAEDLEKEDDQAREAVIACNSDLDELRSSVSLDNEKINALSAESRIYMEEMELIRKRIADEGSVLRELQTRSSAASVKEERINAELAEIGSEMERVTAEAREKEERFDSERDLLYEVSLQSAAKGSELSGIRQIRKTLEDRLKALKERREELNDEVSYENEYSAAKRKCEAIEQAIMDESLRATELKAALISSTQGFKNAVEALAKTEKALSQARARRDMLEQLENSYEGYSHAVRFIMNESGLEDIYGAVGGLIQVPPGFETAVDTALGARVQNMVCKDENSARSAIRMLKTRRAGRLTFLPLTGLRVMDRRKDSSLESEDGFIGIAADCVKYEERFAGVIEHLLGNTVIVRDLDDAISISKSYGGYRYVTLDGEFISPAGAITGGTQKNSSTSILERKNRFYAEEKTVHQLESEMRDLQTALSVSSDERAAAMQNVKNSEERSRSLEIELINAKNEAEIFRQRSEEHQQSTGRTFREIERTEQALYENAGYISALEKEKAVSDSKMVALKNSIEVLSGQTGACRARADELKEKFTAICIRSEAARTEAAAAEAQIKDSLRRIESLKADLEIKDQAAKASEAGKEVLWSRIAENTLSIKEKEAECASAARLLEELRLKKQRLAVETERLRTDRESLDKTLFTLRTTRHDLTVRTEAAAGRIDSWKNRLWDEFELSYLEALEKKKVIFDLNEGIKESKRLKLALRDLGDVNLGSIAEYEEVSRRYSFMTAQKKDLDDSVMELRRIIQDTDAKIRAAFKSSFDAININFRKIFAELFGGGHAELRTDRDTDPLEADIEIAAQPPGKKLQNMNLLSGGEKTMTAIALMFAVLKTKPTPFCILDEVEAALDEANIERFAAYLERFEGIQFVLVTHQKVTMEHANVLYGVTMPEKGISKVLSLKLSDAADWEVRQ